MHDMSNTRKEIAARLGFAAKEVFADKRTTAGALRKALKAKGITSAADLEWHGISANDPDSTPYWLYEDGSMEKIKAFRPGTKAAMAKPLRKAEPYEALYYKWFSGIQVSIMDMTKIKNDINAIIASGANPDVEMPKLVKKYASSSSSRPGAKTSMTREQTEEQKAGLKIMSAADPAVGEKIATLIKEGKPQDQAVAIALDMKRRGEL